MSVIIIPFRKIKVNVLVKRFSLLYNFLLLDMIIKKLVKCYGEVQFLLFIPVCNLHVCNLHVCNLFINV